MELLLNTWQRVNLATIVGDIAPSARIMHKASRLLDLIELSDRDRDLVGWSQTETRLTDGRDITAYSWKDKEHRFKVEIKDRNLVEFLIGLVKEYVWPKGQWLQMRKEIADLYEQLGIVFESEDVQVVDQPKAQPAAARRSARRP